MPRNEGNRRVVPLLLVFVLCWSLPGDATISSLDAVSANPLALTRYSTLLDPPASLAIATAGSFAPEDGDVLSIVPAVGSQTAMPAGASFPEASLPVPIGINFHGGSVMWQPITLYLVWYGAFSEKQKQIVRQFVRSLSPGSNPAVTVSDWWNIDRYYYDSSGNQVTATVKLGAEAQDASKSLGPSLTPSSEVWKVLSNALSSGLPTDPNGVYVIIGDAHTPQIGAPGIEDKKFCVHYCGWHAYQEITPGTVLKYAFVGNAGLLCPGACISPTLQSSPSAPPNGDLGIDGLVSILGHEVAEAASDPLLRTWFASTGEENADICQFRYGDVQQSKNGSIFNLVGIDNSTFLVQQNWDLTTGQCVTTMPEPISSLSTSLKSPPLSPKIPPAAKHSPPPKHSFPPPRSSPKPPPPPPPRKGHHKKRPPPPPSPPPPRKKTPPPPRKKTPPPPRKKTPPPPRTKTPSPKKPPPPPKIKQVQAPPSLSTAGIPSTKKKKKHRKHRV